MNPLHATHSDMAGLLLDATDFSKLGISDQSASFFLVFFQGREPTLQINKGCSNELTKEGTTTTKKPGQEKTD